MFSITLHLNFYKPQLGFPSTEVSPISEGKYSFGNNAYIFFCLNIVSTYVNISTLPLPMSVIPKGKFISDV